MLNDQTVVAGIGNIYSDEILFAFGIYSSTRYSDLTGTELECLAQKIQKIILWAIEKNEITPEEYLQGKGRGYRNTPYLRIYGRYGQPCTHCGAAIEKIAVGGRSSCYCPRCQTKK